MLFVNVASECGYTPQYEGLQELYEKYEKDGLVVIGVPANEFGKQEPGTDEEIKKFCTTQVQGHLPDDVEGRREGEGPGAAVQDAGRGDPERRRARSEQVGWNFEKFLIGRDGKVVGRFKSAVAPNADELVKAIKTELDKAVPRAEVMTVLAIAREARPALAGRAFFVD